MERIEDKRRRHLLEKALEWNYASELPETRRSEALKHFGRKLLIIVAVLLFLGILVGLLGEFWGG